MRPVIIIPAFSRPLALKRLLDAINHSHFPDGGVHLIISIDGEGDKEVERIANDFVFQHGSYEVISRIKNIGLREHILWCGDQTEKYSSIIIIEDDIYIDPFFYKYASSCLDFYQNDETIAGIALYSPKFNEYSALPFQPMYNGTSTYFMQVPCSWGQAWTQNQWKKFRAWYGQGESVKVDNCKKIPSGIKKWSDRSWKKYFAAYLAESNKYFVYPYISYSTNCADSGSHIKKARNFYQVPLSFPDRIFEKLSFSSLERTLISYDPFMEASAGWLEKYLNLPSDSLCVDLHGVKSGEVLESRKYCLTSREVKSSKSNFSLRFQPIELNALLGSNISSRYELFEGHQIYLTESNCINKKEPFFIKLYEYSCHFSLWSNRFISSYLTYFPKKIIQTFLPKISK